MVNHVSPDETVAVRPASGAARRLHADERRRDCPILVFFNEFSANLTPQARVVVAEAARRAKEMNSQVVRIEARASATGSAVATQRLAETRSQVVADELQADGFSPAMLRQVAVGQTGSGDPTVAERRVDIVLEQ